MGGEWTIHRVLEWTADYFTRQGIASARLDAELLLAHVLGLDRVGLYVHYEQPLSRKELASLRELVRRRARREPVAYILGRREFWSLEFEVGPEVLIPRPETEFLVEAVLRLLRREETACPRWQVLDLGTGCGVIGICLAKEETGVQVVATDVSPAALVIARRNACRLGVAERVAFVAGDLFSPLACPQAIFDVVVSNPPYVPAGDFARLCPEVTVFEPRVALDGGKDGLEVIRRIVREAPEYVRPGGYLALEIGAGQLLQVLGLLEACRRYSGAFWVRDYAGIPRVVLAKLADRVG